MLWVSSVQDSPLRQPGGCLSPVPNPGVQPWCSRSPGAQERVLAEARWAHLPVRAHCLHQHARPTGQRGAFLLEGLSMEGCCAGRIRRRG